MHWSEPYVGLPWQWEGRSRAGVDCWGLAWLIYRELKGVDLARYAGAVSDEAEAQEIAAIVNDDRGRAPWCRVSRPREFDIAVFRRGRFASHVGIVVSPEKFLHVLDDSDSQLARMDTGRWAMKLDGLYRHKDLM